MQHYEVRVAQFGRYPHGSIIPEYVVTSGGHRPETLVESGVLSPTGKPTNCELVMPAPVGPPDGHADLLDERNRLVEQVKDLRRDNDLLVKRVAELERLTDIRDRALAKQASDIAHLTEACETHQSKIDELTAELDAATAPAAG